MPSEAAPVPEPVPAFEAANHLQLGVARTPRTARHAPAGASEIMLPTPEPGHGHGQGRGHGRSLRLLVRDSADPDTIGMAEGA